MLPVLPLIIGGAVGVVAGVALKKYYDEIESEIHEKFESSLMDIEEWLDEKLVALDKYKDSLNLNDDENIISSTSNEHSLKKLQDMKQKVYHDCFVDFINFLQDIRNEVVHGSIASKDEANTLRNKILGVADDSILTDILKYKKKILESRT